MFSHQACSRSVLKIGGSILDNVERPFTSLWPKLLQRAAPSLEPLLVVFGGGERVDHIRWAWKEGHCTDREAHHQSIEVMSHHALAIGDLLHMPVESNLRRACASTHEVIFFAPSEEVEHDMGRTLPVGWEVTSDSIACWLAWQSGAPRLVLAKMVGKMGRCDPAEAASKGWVDAFFPVIAERFLGEGGEIDWINAMEG